MASDFTPAEVPAFTGAPQPDITSTPPPESQLAALLNITSAFTTAQVEPDIGESADLIAEAPVTQKLFHTASMLANSLPIHIPVTITGPSGAGKELLARRFRKVGKPFIALNMAALPETLISSILFGHAKGSFTGATESTHGAFAVAADGAIFLDEIGDMPMHLQPILLRVIQERVVSRVGEPADKRLIRCRIICATNKRLDDDNLFRPDLYARLNMIRLHLPSIAAPEREADYFAIGKALGLSSEELTLIRERYVETLFAHNIRALQGFATRKYYLGNMLEGF